MGFSRKRAEKMEKLRIPKKYFYKPYQSVHPTFLDFTLYASPLAWCQSIFQKKTTWGQSGEGIALGEATTMALLPFFKNGF